MTDGEELTVLCVDPDSTSRDRTVSTFEERAHFRVLAASDRTQALELAESDALDCVVSAYRLPDGTAFDLFEAVRERQPNVACVLFTDLGHTEIDSAAFRDTVAEYLPNDGENAHDRLVDVVRNTVVNRTQVGFPLPPDEDERLDAVAEYDVAHLRAVDTFDRLSALIASHFDIRVAFVGLVDEVDEQFIACHGAEWETLAREDSICTYAILEEDVTVVEDVQADPRFEYNRTLEELDIRSYAGANITVDGQVVGELCLIDDEPRTYTEAEREDLRLFAQEVSEQLVLRRRLRQRAGVE